MTNQPSIAEILEELMLETSTNAKLATLKANKDNDLLREVLRMTYDKSVFAYGVQRKTLEKIDVPSGSATIDLNEGLRILRDEFATGVVTGNRAKQRLEELLGSLSTQDQRIVTNVLVRDQRIGVGKTQINKVWKDCIVKPAYSRCSVLNPKTLHKAKFPALIQKKADGTYREFRVEGSEVMCMSRSGETYEHPRQFQVLKNYPDGVYFGELTVRGISDRKIGNGMINSKNPPHDDIILELWDRVSLQEYSRAMQGSKGNEDGSPYSERFSDLKDIVGPVSPVSPVSDTTDDSVRLIETLTVYSMPEAVGVAAEWMSRGYEGAVLKNLTYLFKNGTSSEQFKIKLEVEADVRCVGFKDGTPGTKREGKIGSVMFANDEGTIRGFCSGFDDALLDEMSQNPEKYLGRVFEVQFNDLTKAANHEYWALSHPRFIEFRDDKDSTDTLERVQGNIEMAILAGGSTK